jgi:hypothetical protein
VSVFAPLAVYYSQELDNWIHATQGLCKINKAQFYKLFKPAFDKAFTNENITLGFSQTGLYPLNPAIILDQLPTQPILTSSRPSSKGSGTQSSISLSDWRKINQVVKEALGDVLGHQGRRILKHCHQLQAENALLKAEIEGLQEAVRIEKKRKKPKKALFTELRGEEGNAAIFFSPTKISAARELQAQKAREEEIAQAQKEQEKVQRQQRKEEQAELKRVAAALRQEKRERVATEKALKKTQREDIIVQRLANLQLSNEQRAIVKAQKKRLLRRP